MPTAVTMVTVRAEVRDPVTSAGAQGVVRFRLPYALRDATDHILFGNTRPITAVLVDGIAVFEAPANDSAGVSPQGFAYTIEIDTDVMTSEFFALLPSIPDDVHLSDLVPVLIPPPVGVPGGGIVGISSPDASITVGGTSTSKTVIVAASVQSAISTAQSTATAAGGAAAAAQSTATSAAGVAAAAYVKPGSGIPSTDLTSGVQNSLGLAGTAYQKPGPGVPKADLAAAVQTSLGLADTALQSAPVQSDRYLTPLGAHSANLPFFSVNAKSTINNEAWFGKVIVRAGSPLASAIAVRSSAAATHNTTGLNGFAIWDAAAANLLWQSASDDAMWETVGKVTKPITGIATPSVDTAFWVAVSCRGYSVAPEFGFVNLASTAVFGDFYGRYKGGGYTAWPASFNPLTDLSSGGSFVLPVMIG